MRKEDGTLTTSAKEYTKCLRDWFATIFARLDIPFDPTVLDLLADHAIYWA